jgi:demethylmenaquinone methyltransferase/2-methoxy-6-polyprenyl-1,4-benzoquinol methylase
MLHGNRDIFIKNIFSGIAPYIDFLSTAFSFGLSNLWRKNLISISGIKRGDRVLDVCSGTGELALLIMKEVGPHGSVVGIDFCEAMLKIANKKTNSRQKNISFILSDAKELGFPDDTFDVVTVAFGMRNIPDTILALEEIERVLKPRGRFLCLELTRPQKRWFLPIYKGYVFKVMPFVAKIISKTATPYMYLPRSIDAFYKREEFKHIIEECGFSEVTVHSMTIGVATLYGAIKNG